MVIYMLLNTGTVIKIFKEINCFLIIIYISIQFKKCLFIPLEISMYHFHAECIAIGQLTNIAIDHSSSGLKGVTI